MKLKRLTNMTDYILNPYSDIEERLMDIEDILGDEYDLERLRELARADKEGRCVVLPVVSATTIKEFTEALEYAFAEWNCYDPSVGLFGTSDEERKLQDSIVAALRRERDG